MKKKENKYTKKRKWEKMSKLQVKTLLKIHNNNLILAII